MTTIADARGAILDAGDNVQDIDVLALLAIARDVLDRAIIIERRNRKGQVTMETPYCEWYALCANLSVGTTPHPVLVAVPICSRCADKHGLDVDEWEGSEI